MSDARSFFRSHVFVCKTERPKDHPRGCCAQRSPGDLHAYMKERAEKAGLTDVRINQSGCLDRCELGPTIVIYPESVWYTYRNKDDIDEIIQKHLIEGGRVERLMLMPDDKEPADREARLAAMAKAS